MSEKPSRNISISFHFPRQRQRFFFLNKNLLFRQYFFSTFSPGVAVPQNNSITTLSYELDRSLLFKISLANIVLSLRKLQLGKRWMKIICTNLSLEVPHHSLSLTFQLDKYVYGSQIRHADTGRGWEERARGERQSFMVLFPFQKQGKNFGKNMHTLRQ